MIKFVVLRKKLDLQKFDISSFNFEQLSLLPVKISSVSYWHAENILFVQVSFEDDYTKQLFSDIISESSELTDTVYLDLDKDIIPEASMFLNIIDIIVDRCTK